MEGIYKKIFVGIIASKLDKSIREIIDEEKAKLEILSIEPKNFYKEFLQATKEACELLEEAISIMEKNRK